MKQERVKTSNFNKHQRVNDVWKKAADYEERVRPPPALIEKALVAKHGH